MKNRVAVVAVIVLSLGILTAYFTHNNPPIQPEQCEVITLNAAPVDLMPIEWIQKYNPVLSESDALDMYDSIEQTIARYKADPVYQKGAALQITPKLFLALIIKESSCRWCVISGHGAIGLAQVMPLHLKNLYKAGVIESPEVEELLESEANIRAGIHILMGYARSVKTIEKALCRYNAGPNKEWAGRSYARAVLKLYWDMGGNN